MPKSERYLTHDRRRTLAGCCTRCRGTVSVVVAALMLLSGCVNGRSWNPLGTAAPPVLSSDVTANQVVAHLNSNIERCYGWQCHKVSVKSNDFIFKASATVAVESPRNFRMVVKAMEMPQADLGSNADRMWFWLNQEQADGGQYAYTCSHADLPQAQAKTGLPFRPTWLTEVLGVVPLDPTQVTMRSVPGNNGAVCLESPVGGENGQTYARRIVVDRQAGVIVSHALVDAASGMTLAEAKLQDHQPDPETGVVLPHRIVLEYPSMNSQLTLTLADIDVNPANFPPSTWQPTVASAYPFMDILSERVVTLDSQTVTQ